LSKRTSNVIFQTTEKEITAVRNNQKTDSLKIELLLSDKENVNMH